jgi:hypothetical protein
MRMTEESASSKRLKLTRRRECRGRRLPRDSYQLMSKVTTFHEWFDPQVRFDELRRTSQTEYFDIMLLHWQHTAYWPETIKRRQDGILEAQQRKVIRTHGASVNGLPALRQMPGTNWLDVGLSASITTVHAWTAQRTGTSTIRLT